MVARALLVALALAASGCEVLWYAEDANYDGGPGSGVPVFEGDPAFASCVPETDPAKTEFCLPTFTTNGMADTATYFCSEMPTTAQLVAHDCGRENQTLPGDICCPPPNMP